MAFAAVMIFLFPGKIIAVFSSEPDVMEITVSFLRIAVVSYLMIGFVSVLQQCISSAGDTLPPMLISLALIWAIQLPLAFVLPRITDLGVFGIRWAMVAGTAFGAIAYVAYFRLGRWKQKRL